MNSETGEFSANLQITSAAADAIQSIDQVGEIVLPVTVASQNYNDATINVVVMPTARSEKTVTIEGVPDSKTKTFGDEPFTLTATVNDEGAKASDWYWYSSDPSVLEVANTGSNTMSIKVKSPGSAQIMAWYEPTYALGYEGTQYIGAALTESITVNKAELTPTVTIVGWTYSAYNEQTNAPSVSDIPEGASKEIQESSELKVTYKYKAKDAADSTYTATVPTLAGTYTVRATVPKTANYKSAACTADFSIAKKKVTATVTAVDKTYDGTTDATVSATVNKDDLVQSDLDDAALVEDGKVAVSGLSGSFADKNAGTGKTVSLNYDKVVSPVANAECYEVTGEMPKASITPLVINVGTADKSSHYGEPLAELAQTSFTYDGKAKEPAVKVTLGERKLVAGTDYDVSYKDNTDAGTATVTVTGKGNYAGVAKGL